MQNTLEQILFKNVLNQDLLTNIQLKINENKEWLQKFTNSINKFRKNDV
jgi:hypothetical protein